jgi:hypothetical protein
MYDEAGLLALIEAFDGFPAIALEGNSPTFALIAELCEQLVAALEAPPPYVGAHSSPAVALSLGTPFWLEV